MSSNPICDRNLVTQCGDIYKIFAFYTVTNQIKHHLESQCQESEDMEQRGRVY